MSVRLGNGNWAVSASKLLAYNDAAGPFFNKEFDFTRATTATRINKSGLIELVDNNIARIDFTGSSDGHLLLEPESTNLITFSEDLVVGTGNTSQQNGIETELSTLEDPMGGKRAVKYTNPGIFNASLKKTVSAAADTNFVVSIFIKKTEETSFSNNTKVRMEIFNNTAATTASLIGDALNAAPIGEWIRYSASAVSDSDGGNIVCALRTDEAATFDIFGFQCEANDIMSSYIPTSGSTVTRNNDICLDSGTSQDFNSLEGVLYCEIAALVDGDTNRNIAISDGTTSNTVEIFYQSGTNTIKWRLKANTNSDVQTTVNDIDRTEFNKIAFKYKSGDSTMWLNGVKRSTDTDTFNLSGSLSELSFSNGTSGNAFEGKVREVRVYTKALTDAELTTLTT